MLRRGGKSVRSSRSSQNRLSAGIIFLVSLKANAGQSKRAVRFLKRTGARRGVRVNEVLSVICTAGRITTFLYPVVLKKIEAGVCIRVGLPGLSRRSCIARGNALALAHLGRSRDYETVAALIEMRQRASPQRLRIFLDRCGSPHGFVGFASGRLSLRINRSGNERMAPDRLASLRIEGVSPMAFGHRL